MTSIGVALAGTACAGTPTVHPPRQAVAVTVTPARRQAVPYNVQAYGVVTPLQTATVVPQVDGILKDVMFSEGQSVAQGQVLFRIDPRPYQAAKDQAVAMLARDRATTAYALEQAARYDTLVQSRSVTREQADQMIATAASSQATVASDQAALDLAQFNLDNTVIRAPISGRTGSVLVRAGNVVHAAGGTPLVVINQVRPTLVRFAVPGSILPMILRYGAHGGLPVTAMPSDAPSASLSSDSSNMDAAVPRPPVAPGMTRADSAALNPDGKGVLSFIDNAIDTTTATLQLKAIFPNTSGSMWAGQFVATSLRLFIEDSALVVPTAAVVTGQTGTYVWVIDASDTAVERPVVVERAAGDLSVIASGVSEGDQVVTSGQSRLSSGVPVTLATTGDSASAGHPGRGGQKGGRSGRGTGKGTATP